MAYEDEKKGELETLLNDILEDKNTNLTPENLKKGVTVLGVDGNYIGTDTSDATATNEDVLEGKTAYAQGQKLTGTLRVEDVDSVLDMFPSIETEISEEIDIKDAVENSFNDLSIYGNSRQESTTGKNLLYEIISGYLTTVENQEATTTESTEEDKFGNWQIGLKNKDGSTSISLEAGEYYVSLDLKINSGSVSNPLNRIALSNKDGQETINNPVPTTKYQRYCFKSIFNSAKNVNNIIIQKHYDEEICSFKIKNVMISKMSDYIYEPYTGGNPSPNPDYPQEIESIKDSIAFKRIGKNYNKYPYYDGDVSSQNGLTYTIQEDLGIKIEGTSTGQSYYNLHKSYKLKKGTYKVSVVGLTDNIQLIIVPYLKDGSHLDALVFDKNNTVKDLILEEDVALNDYIAIVNTDVTVNTVLYLQIEKGTEVTEYEPYHEDVYTINLNTDLNSINILSKQLEYNYVDEDGNKYLCDVIDFKNKKIIKYLNKIILPKENITWTQNKDETDFFEIANYTILSGYQAKGDLAISNYFRDDRYKSNYIVTSKSTVFIRFPKFSGINTLQKAQEFMDTHDVEVLYVLANPKEIALTDEELSYLEQFPLQNGINHIFSDDELSPKFKLKYYRDINMMLESEIINNAESKFNIFYDSKVEEFNTNADEKLKGYNTNATSKINEYDANADEKLKGYNTNATNKINEYNTNADEKLEEFNSNATEKTTAYNTNADEKLEGYNTNATNKLNEYNTNATNKINEYNTNAEAILKILPKTETEVLEEIDIDDAGESSFNKLSVFGNSRQESTEGYNLFDYLNNIRNTSGNNITVEKDDKMGYIIVNGTPNVNYAIIVSNLNITDLIEDKQTYTLKQENANNLSINYIYSQIIIENKETLQKQYIGTRTTFKQTFTVDKTTYNYYANIQTGTIESTGTLNNFKTRFMIYKGTDDKTFELYTGGNPSPNPDYPQEIESIKDSITFKRIGESIYNFYNTIYRGERSGIQTHKNNDGSITFIGTPRMSYIYLSDEVDISNLLEDGETYTILQTSYENIYIEIKLRNRVDSTIAKYIKTKDTKQSFLVDKSKYIYVIHVQYGVLPEEGENINTTLKFYLIKGEDDNYTLPVQQNMYALVEGQEDCFVKKDGKWYERHYSFEGELTGEDYNVEKPDTRLAIYNMNTYGFSKGVYNGKTKQYLNYFKFYNNWDNGGSFIAGNSMWFSSSLDKETFKEFIKTKKEEGNPIKIVYIRGEENGSILYPLDLECTPEQVEVLNQLEQFPLQKGINHIFSDDELSPKFQLKYYQDVNILLDKINKSIADVSAQLL